MSVFSNLKQYVVGKWSLKASRSFTPEEIAEVKEAKVVSSQFGNSVCFTLLNGNQTFMPMSRDSQLGVNEVVNLAEAKILTLSKEGEEDILRIEA